MSDDEAWWERPRPPQPVLERRSEPRSQPAVPPEAPPAALRGVEVQLALEALGALVADTHLRREHWDLAQRAQRRHDSRSCLEDCRAVLALDPDHLEARKLGAKAARDLRQWDEAAALLTPLVQAGEPAGQLDWDRIVAATVAGDDQAVNASVARLGLDPCTWQHPEALILVILDGRAQVARRIGPAAAEILSIAAGDRPQHVGDVVAFDPTPLQVTPIVVRQATKPEPMSWSPSGPLSWADPAGRRSESPTFAEVAASWPPPPADALAAPLPPPPLAIPVAVAPNDVPDRDLGAGTSGAHMPSWPTFRTLAILASGAHQAWIVRGTDPGFEAWDDTVGELRERGWVLRRVPALEVDADDRLGVVALPAALDPSEVRATLEQATSTWTTPPRWQN